MKSERQIISRIRSIKYEGQRQGQGFYQRMQNGRGCGNPLQMLDLMHQAQELEWVLGREVKVKELNWYQKARRIFRRMNRG